MGNVVSFDGFDLRQTGVSAFIVGWGGDPSRTNTFSDRVKSTAVFSGSKYDPRQFTIAVEFNLTEPTLTTTRRKVVGWFMDNANYDRERRLVIEDNGVLYYRECAAVKVTDPHRTIVQFEMESGSPTWKSIDVTQSDLYSGPATNAQNTYRIGNTSSLSARPTIYVDFQEEYVGAYQRYKRSYVIRNGTNSAMKNEPIMLFLGDTSAWVSAGKALSTGYDIEAIIEGKPTRRKLVNFNTGWTQIWVLIPYLPASSSVTIDILYGGGQDRRLLMTGPYHPAFAIAGSSGIANTGSTTTVLNVSPTNETEKQYAANQLIGGTIRFLTGQNAGLQRTISANTLRGNSVSPVPSITMSTALPYVPAVGDVWVVWLSTNFTWNYLVRREDRVQGDYYETWGGWYIRDPTTTGPGDIRFGDVIPGAWNRFLHQANGDDKAQASHKVVGNYKFPIFDAQRRRSSDRTLREEGAFDGVILSSSVPITKITCDYKIKNPAAASTYGQAKAKILYQIYGGDEWSVAHENSAVYTSETTIAAAEYQFLPNKATQIAFVLVGMNVIKNDDNSTYTSVEGEISTVNTSTATSSFSWGDVLRLTKDFGAITIRDAEDTSNILSEVEEASEVGIKELGLVFTINGGEMLGSSLPVGTFAESTRVSRGSYQRLYLGPQTSLATDYTARVVQAPNVGSGVIIDTENRNAAIYKRTGNNFAQTFRATSKLRNIPWALHSTTGYGDEFYQERESVSPEWMLLPPTSGFRPSGHPNYGTTSWTLTNYNVPVTTATGTYNGKAGISFSFVPTIATVRAFDYSCNDMYAVTPGQMFRWSAYVWITGTYYYTRPFLAVGWSQSNSVNTQAAFPVDISSVTHASLNGAQPMEVGWKLVQWQGVVPDGMNYVKIYLIAQCFQHNVPTGPTIYFSDVMVMDDCIHIESTRDLTYSRMSLRSEFL